MFTASHNPAQYNGIKLCRAGAAPIGEETGLAEIKAVVAGGSARARRGPRAGSSDATCCPAFVAHVRSFVDVGALAPLRVVADTANGVGGLVVPAVSRRAAVRLTMLFGELDGTFPNHPADPINAREPHGPPARGRRRAAPTWGSRSTATPTASCSSTTEAQPVSRLHDHGDRSPAAILATRHSGRRTVVHNLICSKAVPEVVRELGGVPSAVGSGTRSSSR